MSIMPVGGWSSPKEGEIIPRTAAEHPPVVVIQAERTGSAFKRAFLGCLGVICALWFIGVMFGFVNGFTKGFRSSASSTSASSLPIYNVSAVQLNSDYEANEAAADAQYAGKRLRVSGWVRSINKDAWGSTYIVLSDDSFFTGTLLGVQASLTAEEAPKAIYLRRGERVVVTCDGVQRVIGSVMLHNCSLQSAPAPSQVAPPAGPDYSY